MFVIHKNKLNKKYLVVKMKNKKCKAHIIKKKIKINNKNPIKLFKKLKKIVKVLWKIIIFNKKN